MIFLLISFKLKPIKLFPNFLKYHKSLIVHKYIPKLFDSKFLLSHWSILKYKLMANSTALIVNQILF